MRMDRFDLNLLVVLDVLLEEKNVTRASVRLNMGQSAASGALARLREYFGDELLVMVGRRLMLTPLAETLVEPVRDTLLKARATIAKKPAFDPATEERRFVIIVSDYVTTVMLAQALRNIAKMAPNITLELRGPPPNMFEEFDRGGIDLMVLPDQYLSSVDHSSAPWFDDKQVCMVCAENLAVGEVLSFDTYMAMGHVAVRFGNERSIPFEEWFLPRYGKQRRVEASVDNFSMLPLLVMGTQRIATLHQRLANHFAERYPVRLIDAPFVMPPLVEVMCWPRYLDQDPAHVWLRQMLTETATARPAL